MTAARELTPAEVLESVPELPPFRVIDAIHAIDDAHIEAG